MDYTTRAIVKDAMTSTATAKDTTIDRVVTAASRTIDRYLTGKAIGSDNYLQTATVTDEILIARLAQSQQIVVWPRKPLISTVTAFAYRIRPDDPWTSVDLQYVEIEGPAVQAWVALDGETCKVKLSYTGGIAATVADLPADIIEAATAISVRVFREDMTGLSDAIGVDELGTLIYTKAMPARVRESLAPYKRVTGW